MANTKSAKKKTRVIARRTKINQHRRSMMRGHIRKVEEAIASGDRAAALAALAGRRAADDARKPEGHRSQEVGEPQGVAPDAPDCQAREVIDSAFATSEASTTRLRPGFLFAEHGLARPERQAIAARIRVIARRRLCRRGLR